MKKELLFSVTKKDLEITWFSGKGAGGQHRNKHQNCVRIRHPDSGVIVTGQEEKSRQANFKKAFTRLTEHVKFNLWINKKAYEMTKQFEEDEKEVNRKVDESMKENNLLIEFF